MVSSHADRHDPEQKEGVLVWGQVASSVNSTSLTKDPTRTNYIHSTTIIYIIH